jgi:hypothetical protein
MSAEMRAMPNKVSRPFGALLVGVSLPRASRTIGASTLCMSELVVSMPEDRRPHMR